MTTEKEIPEELYEHHKVVTDPGQQLLRIDRFLTDRLPNISRNRIQSAAKAGSILVDGKAVKPNYKVKPCEEISIVLSYPKQEFELIPEEIPLDIIHEDEDLVVLNKQA